jgi:hypothetical protein
MWKKLLNLAAQFWRVADENARNRTQIEALQGEVRNLWRALELLTFEVQRTRDNDAHEREKLALRLENELLRFERRLPPSRSK